MIWKLGPYMEPRQWGREKDWGKQKVIFGKVKLQKMFSIPAKHNIYKTLAVFSSNYYIERYNENSWTHSTQGRFVSKYIYNTCYNNRNNYFMRSKNYNKIELFFESNTFALSTHDWAFLDISLCPQIVHFSHVSVVLRLVVEVDHNTVAHEPDHEQQQPGSAGTS